MMHELEDDEPRASAEDRERPSDLAAWRRAERRRQIERRLELAPELRRAHAEQISARLEGEIGSVRNVTVSLYWPMRGEPDLRLLAERLISAGGRCALPVVAATGEPLVFRCWAPGDGLERGVWGIPVPSSGAEVEPDVIVAPLVAFDRACYRLGYGGGYFDRTLAALHGKPRALGAGYSFAALPTIYPEPHDIPMDAIVTESDVLRPVRR